MSTLVAALALTVGSGFLPKPEDVVMYEANLRALGSDHAFAALESRLPDLQRLGINVVWLMPVQPVGKVKSAGGLGSPYAVANYLEVNPEFGTEAEFRHLVDATHRRKIAVVIDWVANHTAWDNPWVAQHPDWYTKNDKGEIVRPAGTNWNDVADLNFDVPEMRTAMTGAMATWVTKFGIDGFRCDAADMVPSDYWTSAIRRLRKESNHPLLMLAEGGRNDHYASGFDLTYGWSFFDRLTAIFRGESARSLASASTREVGGRRLRFTTNHDKAAWDGSPSELFGSDTAAKTAFAVTALYGGTPLVYTGQEVGWTQRIPIFDRSSVSGAPDRSLAEVLAFRSQHPSVRASEPVDLSSDDVIAFFHLGADGQTLVLANVRNRPVDYSVPEGLQRTWKLADGNTVVLSGSVRLAPLEFRLMSRR